MTERGIKSTRCASCGTVILDGADDPMVSLRRTDVEEILRLLHPMPPYFETMGRDATAVYGMLQRLAQALGRPLQEPTS